MFSVTTPSHFTVTACFLNKILRYYKNRKYPQIEVRHTFLLRMGDLNKHGTGLTPEVNEWRMFKNEGFFYPLQSVNL